MLLHLYYDKDNTIKMVSKDSIISNTYKMVRADITDPKNLVGKKIRFGAPKGTRLALICNWNDQCGISTYTQFLMNSLGPKVDAVKIFSENRDNPAVESKYEVEYCWKRGQSMVSTVQKVLDWKPNVVLIQHEFGIFPKANYFLPMMEHLAALPTVVTLHSVYEHRDKSICSAVMPNIIVHSETGKKCLKETLGHVKQNINVIPHGCVEFEDVHKNWNFFGVPYPIVQFGFGFSYKGVDVALEAISILKKRNSKFKDIFYCYLCSESNHAKATHNNYYNDIKDKIKTLGLEDNASIQRGFFSDEELNQYLRTSRLAIFPYVTDINNVVYGASGAIRIAMANKVPVIASRSHMFDDMEGVLPRPFGAEELADEISKVFLDEKHRANLIKKENEYIKANTWDIIAGQYLNVLRSAIEKDNENLIIV